MNNKSEMKEIIDGFLVEAAEILEELSNSLIELEKNSSDEGLINAIFRAFHTLKGTASFLDFSTIEKVAHKLEDLLNLVRQGKRQLSSADVDLIFEGMDLIQELVVQIKETGHDKRDVDPFLQKISLQPSSKKEKSEKKKETRKEKAGNDHDWQTVMIDDDSRDLLDPFLEDLRDSLKRISEMNPADSADLEKILSTIHTIKNSASFIGFEPVVQLSKKAQDHLLSARNKEEICASFVSLLEEMIQDFVTSGKVKTAYQTWLEEEAIQPSPSVNDQEQPHPESNKKEMAEVEPVPQEEKPNHSDELAERVYTISDDLREVADTFFAELEEILQTLNQDFLELEKNPQDQDLLHKIFRGVHTIKGTSGFIGFDHMVELTHVMEDCLNKARNGKLVITPSLMDILLEGVDAITEMKDAFAGGKAVNYPVKAYASRLKAVMENPQNVHGGTAVPAEKTVSAERDQGDKKEKDITKNYLGKFTEQTIRVDVNRLDNLMDLVGELVLSRNRLMQIISSIQANSHQFSDLTEAAENVDFLTTEIQSAVMKTRMVPIGRIFSKFPRMVRDLAREKGKEIELILSGEDTEVDKTVSEEIGDPLVHILRNAVDHGIETPEERTRHGKPPVGTIRLQAFHEGNSIVIEISDDGRGLDTDKIKKKAIEKGLITASEADKMTDTEAYDLIFRPGFSTADKVTNISGRGVGMDVVKTHVTKLNGIISIQSQKGKGTTFRLQLPLTLAIIQGLVIGVQEEAYIIPLSSVLEIYRINPKDVYSIKKNNVIRIRDEVLPLILLEDLFDIPKKIMGFENRYVVVVGLANLRAGIVVDQLIGQKEIVIKSLGEYLGSIKGIAGASILGDGRVRLIVDIGEILSLTKESRRAEHASTK